MTRRLVIGRYQKSARGVYERKLSEEDVLGQIRQFLELSGARVFRSVERVPKCYRCGCYLGYSERGITDLWGWFVRKLTTTQATYRVPPEYFFIEVKRPGGKLRPAQAAWIAQAQADGVIAFKAESVEEMASEFAKYGIVIRGLK